MLKHKRFIKQLGNWLSKSGNLWALQDTEAAAYRLRAMMAQLRDFKRDAIAIPRPFESLSCFLNKIVIASSDPLDGEDTDDDGVALVQPASTRSRILITISSDESYMKIPKRHVDVLDPSWVEEQMFGTDETPKKTRFRTKTSETPEKNCDSRYWQSLGHGLQEGATTDLRGERCQ